MDDKASNYDFISVSPHLFDSLHILIYSMVDIKYYPAFYPPDGIYYIFSKDFGHFWRQRGGTSEGGVVDCEPLESGRDSIDMNHRTVSFMTWIWYVISWSLLNQQVELNNNKPCERKTGSTHNTSEYTGNAFEVTRPNWVLYLEKGDFFSLISMEKLNEQVFLSEQ